MRPSMPHSGVADDGALIVEGRLDRNLLSEVRCEIDPLVAAATLGDNAFDAPRGIAVSQTFGSTTLK